MEYIIRETPGFMRSISVNLTKVFNTEKETLYGLYDLKFFDKFKTNVVDIYYSKEMLFVKVSDNDLTMAKKRVEDIVESVKKMIEESLELKKKVAIVIGNHIEKEVDSKVNPLKENYEEFKSMINNSLFRIKEEDPFTVPSFAMRMITMETIVGNLTDRIVELEQQKQPRRKSQTKGDQ